MALERNLAHTTGADTDPPRQGETDAQSLVASCVHDRRGALRLGLRRRPRLALAADLATRRGRGCRVATRSQANVPAVPPPAAAGPPRTIVSGAPWRAKAL